MIIKTFRILQNLFFTQTHFQFWTFNLIKRPLVLGLPVYPSHIHSPIMMWYKYHQSPAHLQFCITATNTTTSKVICVIRYRGNTSNLDILSNVSICRKPNASIHRYNRESKSLKSTRNKVTMTTTLKVHQISNYCKKNTI